MADAKVKMGYREMVRHVMRSKFLPPFGARRTKVRRPMGEVVK
jgi:hypothetical protein